MLRLQKSPKLIVCATLLALPAAIGLAQSAQAATFTNVQFLTGSTAGTEVLNLASPGQVLTSTLVQYNTINDTTGAKLTTDNGDAKDFTLSGSSTTGALGKTRAVVGAARASTPLDAVDSGRVGFQHSYTNAPTGNNPGTIESNIFTLLFNSNLTVTDASFDFSSLNTKGIAWEYSVLQFLDTAGNPFSALTNPGWALGTASQYGVGPTAGFSGVAGIGNFIAASKGTVIGVGTSKTQTEGADNGPNDNIAALNYALVGLTPGTQIGGIRWTTYLEDVRGASNDSTNFTSSLFDFTISGNTAAATVPTPALLPGLIALAASARRRWKTAQ
jgi:hypothetical protein